MKTRNYCFTYYKTDFFEAPFNIGTKVKYLIMGLEVCPKTKKKHIQGFVIFNNAVANAKKLLIEEFHFDNTLHIEVCKGSPIQNFEYCSKENNFKEFGIRPKQQGKRSDITNIKECINNGGGMRDICEISTSYQSMKCGELLLKYCETPREINKINVFWYYGKSGCGKTKKVYDTFGTKVFRPTTYKWWEGYDAHEIVLIDDWRPEWCSYSKLLNLTDIYPFRVQTKGGSRQVKFHTIIFTCDKHFSDYYPDMDTTELEQLKRRITTVEKFTTAQRSGVILTPTDPENSDVEDSDSDSH